MEKLRQLHNDLKREFIMRSVRKNSLVLDVGAGRGGDLQKWRSVGARLYMCDPDEESLLEAMNRAVNVHPTTEFFKGDVLQAPGLEFDVVCYNFSLQYIFQSEDYARMCIQSISRLLKPGGKFMGVVPDATKILKRPIVWEGIERGPSIGKEGPRYGEMILVRFGDGPYYKNGAVPEPLCYKSLLVDLCFAAKMALIEWEPFSKEENGKITDIYSRFIFHKLK